MSRMYVLMFAAALAASSPRALAHRQTGDTVTMTGWFADAQCAAPRVAKGVIGPNNPDCVKRCLDEGVTAVFVSEQTRKMYEVRDHPSVKADLAYHLEITGRVDSTGTAMSVKSVKRLSASGPMCVRRQKADAPRRP